MQWDTSKGQRKEVVANYQFPERLGMLSKNVCVVSDRSTLACSA